MIYNFIIKNIFLNLLLIFIIIILIIFEIREFFHNKYGLRYDQAIRLINDEKAIILDIRKKELFNKEHILNSINIIVDKNFTENIKKYKNKTLIIFHENDNLSKKYIQILKKKNITNINYLKNGIKEWKENGMPTKIVN